MTRTELSWLLKVKRDLYSGMTWADAADKYKTTPGKLRYRLKALGSLTRKEVSGLSQDNQKLVRRWKKPRPKQLPCSAKRLRKIMRWKAWVEKGVTRRVIAEREDISPPAVTQSLQLLKKLSNKQRDQILGG
jgi:hypothetical protein